MHCNIQVDGRTALAVGHLALVRACVFPAERREVEHGPVDDEARVIRGEGLAASHPLVRQRGRVARGQQRHNQGLALDAHEGGAGQLAHDGLVCEDRQTHANMSASASGSCLLIGLPCMDRKAPLFVARSLGGGGGL